MNSKLLRNLLFAGILVSVSSIPIPGGEEDDKAPAEPEKVPAATPAPATAKATDAPATATATDAPAWNDFSTDEKAEATTPPPDVKDPTQRIILDALATARQIQEQFVELQKDVMEAAQGIAGPFFSVKGVVEEMSDMKADMKQTTRNINTGFVTMRMVAKEMAAMRKEILDMSRSYMDIFRALNAVLMQSGKVLATNLGDSFSQAVRSGKEFFMGNPKRTQHSIKDLKADDSEHPLNGAGFFNAIMDLFATAFSLHD